MRLITILAFSLMIAGCAGVSICGERQYTFEVPSTIPFVSGEFTIRRSSDHVDCHRDPEERELPDG